jgi:prepilin-type N-terminal cleavage/methylation domain-containing protein
MNSKNKMSGTRGFTLVELMVTIAVIAILASLLFPVLTKAKSSTRDTGCVNNLKQAGVKLQFFMNETGDFPLNINKSTNLFPDHKRTWLTSIYDSQEIRDPGGEPLLTSGILRCPAVRRRPENWPHRLPDSSSVFNSYSYNSEGFRQGSDYEFRGVGGKMLDGTRVPVKVESIRNPSALAILGDAFAGDGDQIRDGAGFFRAKSLPEVGDDLSIGRVMARHRKEVVANFSDGHVGRKKIQAVYVERGAEAINFWNSEGSP